MGELRQLNEQNKLAIWAERVTECRNSGQSVLAWCKEHGKVKAHGFCIGNPEPAHPVTLAGNPVLAGDSAKRVKQILVGNRNNTFLFASRLGELESLRFVALAGTDRKYSCFRIQQTQNKGGIAQVLKHLLGESHAILIQEHVRVGVDVGVDGFKVQSGKIEVHSKNPFIS